MDVEGEENRDNKISFPAETSNKATNNSNCKTDLPCDISEAEFKALESSGLLLAQNLIEQGLDTNTNIEALLDASKSGDLLLVQDLINSGLDVNTNINGLNALHLASKEGHKSIVLELLKYGINVDATTKKKNTALHIASLAGHVEIVKTLLDHGCQVNCQSSSGFTPLYMAAQENNFEVVELLISQGADQNISTAEGFTPLAVALQQGHKDIVKLLLENDSKNLIKLPALHVAARKNDTSSAALLLKSKFSVDYDMQDHIVNYMAKNGFTALHIAAHYGNVEVAELLIYRNADVNFPARHGITPLHVAAKCGKDNMVRLLLNHNADVDCKTQDGLTALHCAARAGREQVIDTLLENGALITAKTCNGLTALHMTAQYDFEQSAKILLSYKSKIIDEVTRDKLSALHVASHCGSINVSKLLIERGIDLDAKAKSGFTPLHIACKKAHFQIAQLLIKTGATIDSVTESGLTPLHVAAYMGALSIISLLLENNSNISARTIRGETPLHMATRCNQLHSIQLLLQSGADIDAAADNNQTALHISTYLGLTECLVFLLQHSASIDTMTKGGSTSLHLAAMTGHVSPASVLLKNGASITLCTKKGFTPLHVACKYGNIKIVSLLLQHNAAVDFLGRNGLRPLHIAAHYNHPNITLVLLRSGSSPDNPAFNGYTPLHIAANKNHLEIAQLLLEYNVHINAKSNAGFTPLHLACQEGYVDMVELLLIHGSEINTFANNGLSPLHLCAQENRTKCARKLVKAGSIVDSRTESGYTPLHIAAYYGHTECIQFLVQSGAALEAETNNGYTPLLCSLQECNLDSFHMLIELGAQIDHVTKENQNVLDIGTKLNNATIVDEIKILLKLQQSVLLKTNDEFLSTYTSQQIVQQIPECLQEECPFRDSDDESALDHSLKDQASSSANLQYVSHNIERQIQSSVDDDFAVDIINADVENVLDVGGQNSSLNTNDKSIDKFINLMNFNNNKHQKPLSGTNMSKNVHSLDKAEDPDEQPKFLVSFVVSAKGGYLRGCRHSGVQFIVPPGGAEFPTRITCRFLTDRFVSKTIVQPPIGDGEALVSRVLSLRPVNYRFLSPVLIRIPHFAALHNGEREIVVYRSNNGEKWVEHTPKPYQTAIKDIYNEVGFSQDVITNLEQEKDKTAYILSIDIPRYFAICSRIAQDYAIVDHRGATIHSTFVPGALMYIPERALQKPVKISLQAIVVSDDFISQIIKYGQINIWSSNDNLNQAANNNNTFKAHVPSFSPIISVEPRRRKFHKPITLTIPLPSGALLATQNINNSGVAQRSSNLIAEINENTQVYASDLHSLRLLCSISGGSLPAKWEDITGHTPLTFQKNSVTFTSTVSARFWLMNIEDVSMCTKLAQFVYGEATLVPVIIAFVIFAKRTHPTRCLVRINCITDPSEINALQRRQDNYVLIGQSKPVEVYNNRYITIVLEEEYRTSHSPKKWTVLFSAFHNNCADIVLYTSGDTIDWSVCFSFYQNRFLSKQSITASLHHMMDFHLSSRSYPQSNKHVPLSTMLVTMPSPSIKLDKKHEEVHVVDYMTKDCDDNFQDQLKFSLQGDIPYSVSFQSADGSLRVTVSLAKIANLLKDDWISLGFELGFSLNEIRIIRDDVNNNNPGLTMLLSWLTSSGSRKSTLGFSKHIPNGSTLELTLKRIGRENIVHEVLASAEISATSTEKTVDGEQTISKHEPSENGKNITDAKNNLDTIVSLADRIVQSFSPKNLTEGLLDSVVQEIVQYKDVQDAYGALDN